MPTEWFFTDARGDRVGPVTAETLSDLARAGVVTPVTEVSRDGRAWHPASRVRGLDFGDPPSVPSPADPEPWCYRVLTLASAVLRVVAWLPLIAAGVLACVSLFGRIGGLEVALLAPLAGLLSWLSLYTTSALLTLLLDIARQLRRLSSR